MRRPCNGTEATTAPLRLQMEQSHRRGETIPSGRSSSSTTAPQWHEARCLDWILTPQTSLITRKSPLRPDAQVKVHCGGPWNDVGSSALLGRTGRCTKRPARIAIDSQELA